ncbi:hypothetical protein U1Q18_008884 [Sarracenia purpurea var. burkii]
MAGHAGRRSIDERGHVVLIQTPYEGAEECSKLLFSGLEPLVSQFTASYGMVLNLLAGGKITRRSNELDGMKASRAGRTLEEARKLVEQSFGNYVGSNVMLSAKEELSKIQNEIEMLTSEISDEAIDRKTRKLLPDRAYKEIADLQEELRCVSYVNSPDDRKGSIPAPELLQENDKAPEETSLSNLSLSSFKKEIIVIIHILCPLCLTNQHIWKTMFHLALHQNRSSRNKRLCFLKECISTLLFTLAQTMVFLSFNPCLGASLYNAKDLNLRHVIFLAFQILLLLSFFFPFFLLDVYQSSNF